MGDRALIQLKADGRVSPVLYLHWGGSEVDEVLRSAQERMKNRPGDIDYAFARLVQAAIGADKYDTGYGVWNATTELDEADSHGDAGVFIVNVQEAAWRVKCLGGYGFRCSDDGEDTQLAVDGLIVES